MSDSVAVSGSNSLLSTDRQLSTLRREFPSDSSNPLVCTNQNGPRNRDTQTFGGSEVHDKSELGRLLDGKLAWFSALKDLVYISCSPSERVVIISRVCEQYPRFRHSTPSLNTGSP